MGYSGRYAQLYDLFYSIKKYDEEASFLDHCFKRFGDKKGIKKILELACGTGTHAIELTKLGYSLTATDISKDMLARGVAKASVHNMPIEFMIQDMRKIPPLNHAYDAAICLFDSIGHVILDEDLNSVFQGVASSIRSGGLFVCEFIHAKTMINHYEPYKLREIKIHHGKVLRISETAIDHKKKLARVKFVVFESANNGKFSFFEARQSFRFFDVQEIENHLHSQNFKTVKIYAGYTTNENIDETIWHVLVIARRN